MVVLRKSINKKSLNPNRKQNKRIERLKIKKNIF